jgi:putative colanic acid biosynthesis acetyltransferase WcaF
MPVVQDLSRFRLPPGFRGRSGVVVLAWQIVQATLFGCSPQPCYGWRRFLLRLFGATIGSGVLVRPTARITYPWKVRIGARSWIGDHVVLYSLGSILIGSDTVVSQKSYLCAATHDYRRPEFPLLADAIMLGDGVWLATDVFVAPGVAIASGAVIGARSSVFQDIGANVIAFGSPAKPAGRRDTSAP